MNFKIFLLGGCLLASLIDFTSSANILVVEFLGSKSHKITYMHLVEELGKRGHTITTLTGIKPFKEMKNVKEIYTFDAMKEFVYGDKENTFNPFEVKEKGQQNMDPTSMITMAAKTCEKSLDLPQVRALLKEKFDLVIFQPGFNDCVLGLIYRLQAPFALFVPTYIPSFILSKVGGHHPTSFNPNVWLGYSSEMTFSERFFNFGTDVIAEAFLKFLYQPQIEKIYREKLGQDIPSINEIYANASLILANTHFTLIGPRPNFPDVVDFGGIHSRPAKALPKDLEDFIKKGDGFILFSMGSAIKGDMMPEAKRKMILNVFSKLKQQVLWKWESESMPDLPKNVKLSKWLPQEDLLGHKDIKMFITHCGGGSTEESIYHGVPLIGIPMLGDQLQNADFAQKHGFIIQMQWNDMTEESFHGAIQEVLNNPKYRDNVKNLSTIFKDRPVDPLDLGVYWVEYVIKHKGAPQLRHPGRKMNFLQYHSYDIILTYLAIIMSTLYLTFAILKFTARKIFCRSSKKNDKSGNGKKNN